MRTARLALVLFGLMLAGCDAAFADEPFFGTEKASAVMNAPGVAVQVGKAATNIVEPGIETLYDLRLGEWRYGTSMVVWTFVKDDAPLVSIRAGYVVDYLPYLSAPVDLKTATTRYVLPVLPASIEGYLGVGPLNLAWSAIGKYAILGPWVGYNYDRQEDGNSHDGGLAFGVSLGAKLKF